MTRILKCPVCHIRLSSQKLILVHIVKRHANPVDLLPWKINTRRRGSNTLALAAIPNPAPVVNQNILAVAEPPMLPAQPENGIGLVVNGENRGLDEIRALDLPIKKRLTYVAANRNEYTCQICGKVYTSGRALGGHKAQHTIRARKMRRQTAAAGAMVVHAAPAGAMVVQEPEPEPERRPVGPHQCQRCGREFASGRGLGGHKQHCRRRAAQPPPERVVWDIDLNELPPVE